MRRKHIDLVLLMWMGVVLAGAVLGFLVLPVQAEEVVVDGNTLHAYAAFWATPERVEAQIFLYDSPRGFPTRFSGTRVGEMGTLAPGPLWTLRRWVSYELAEDGATRQGKSGHHVQIIATDSLGVRLIYPLLDAECVRKPAPAGPCSTYVTAADWGRADLVPMVRQAARLWRDGLQATDAATRATLRQRDQARKPLEIVPLE